MSKSKLYVYFALAVLCDHYIRVTLGAAG